MRRALLLVLVVAALPAALPASSGAGTAQAPLSCGVPQAPTVWIEFADSYVSFWRERFARPGIVIATGGPILAQEARQSGAATVHWDMYLNRRVGTPSAPADPSLIEGRADALYAYAVSVTGCETPLIALNELWGASLPVPLTPTAERYRSNVLRFVTRLSERGARPALLVSSEPFTGGDAAEWWRAIGRVSDLVLEEYANANVIWREGAVDGQRRLRVKYRRSVATLLAIGIPPSRIGLMIGFQTGPGVGGREGLAPRSRWFSVAKWQAFASKQVARELRLPHVWSWGWAQRNERSNDPDKTYAACVWLWARDAKLCDAPGILGRELDTDRRTGQIDLRPGLRCVYGRQPISAAAVAAIQRVTRDQELALTALVTRIAERDRIDVSTAEVLAAERRIIVSRFGGSERAYRAALTAVGAGRPVARGIVEDELRRARVMRALSARPASPRDVERFRETYATVLARRVLVSPVPSWLAAEDGIALSTSAPPAVFRIAARGVTTLRTAEGVYRVRALGAAEELGTFSRAEARPAIVHELREQQRAEAYAQWTVRMQRAAEHRLACTRDRLPELGVVSLASFAPFLSLSEPDASTWLAAYSTSRR